MAVALKKPIILLSLLAFFFSSCITKYSSVELETNIPVTIPFAYGSYTLGDLFYNLDDTVVVKTGQFYELNDTISVSNESSMVTRAKNVEIIFRSINYMPFQVDLEVASFDSLTYQTGNKIQLKLIEAAVINTELEVAIPVNYESSVLLDDKTLAQLKDANSLLIKAKFIWPYESVSAPIIDEMAAFDLDIFIKVEL